jgi:hypothetical protein
MIPADFLPVAQRWQAAAMIAAALVVWFHLPV